MDNTKVIELQSFGILPDTEDDYTEKLNKLFRENPENTVFRFEKGIYRFHHGSAARRQYAMTSCVPGIRSPLLMLSGMKNVVIDGGGAKFLFYGYVMPFVIEDCCGITLKNFTVDWEKPTGAEGVVTAKSTDYIDVKIDRHLFPCKVQNFSLFFDIGDGQESEITYGRHVAYDSQTNTVTQNCADRIRFRGAEQVSEDVFRLYVAEVMRDDIPPYVGNTIVLNHSKCSEAGIFAENCENTVCEDITMHSADGIGMLFQFCRGISAKRIDFVPNIAAGRRVICACDGGFHIACCSGDVLIEDCRFHGLQNDPVEIHGIYASVKKQTAPDTLLCEFLHPNSTNYKYWAKPGQTVTFMTRKNMKTAAEAAVKSYRLVADSLFELVLEAPLPDINIKNEAILADNYDNSPSVTVRNKHFGACRARGLLLVTPKPVVIEDNIFESGGAAIMLSNDTSFWYNSGCCTDVTVRNNVFSDACFLSTFQFSYAVITVRPDILRPSADIPFNRGIVIENNLFMSSDTPILYAFATEGLVFRHNRIFRTDRVPTKYFGKSLFTLKYCRNALISDNPTVGGFSLEEMRHESTTFRKK